MQIINIIVLGFTSRLLGGMGKKEGEDVCRTCINIPLFAYILYAAGFDLVQFGAIAWLFAVVRFLPTNHLLSSMYNSPPTWRKTPFNFLYDTAKRIYGLLPFKANWRVFGVIYGFLRASLALPAIIYLGGAAWLFLFHGLLYVICGKLFKNGSKWAEVITGALVGYLI